MTDQTTDELAQRYAGRTGGDCRRHSWAHSGDKMTRKERAGIIELKVVGLYKCRHCKSFKFGEPKAGIRELSERAAIAKASPPEGGE